MALGKIVKWGGLAVIGIIAFLALKQAPAFAVSIGKSLGSSIGGGVSGGITSFLNSFGGALLTPFQLGGAGGTNCLLYPLTCLGESLGILAGQQPAPTPSNPIPNPINPVTSPTTQTTTMISQAIAQAVQPFGVNVSQSSVFSFYKNRGDSYVRTFSTGRTYGGAIVGEHLAARQIANPRFGKGSKRSKFLVGGGLR